MADLAAPQTVELCKGLVIDTKFKVGAILWLEEKYGKSLLEIKFDTGRMTDVANMIVALARQHDPKLTEAKALELIGTLDIDDIEAAIPKITEAFEVQLKNSQKTAPEKKDNKS